MGEDIELDKQENGWLAGLHKTDVRRALGYLKWGQVTKHMIGTE